MASFLDPRPAAVGDLVQQKLAEKYHPSVLKFYLTWTVYNISNKMPKFYDDVCSFECEGPSIRKALQIDVWEMAWVTAMAAVGEQTRSVHVWHVSLGARIDQ